MKKLPRYLNKFSIVASAILLLCIILQIAFMLCPDFADAFNVSIGRTVRFLLAKLTVAVPFSVGELLLLSSPIIIFAICLVASRAARRGAVHAWRTLISTALAASLVWCAFVLDFSAGYRGTPLSSKLSLDDVQITEESLYYTADMITSELNKLCSSTLYMPDGASLMPFSYNELSSKLSESYGRLCDDYSFIDRYETRVKPLVISKYMTYTHISGVYSFFSGEANLNTNFPDYICTYTAAHEMAHQRGISREDEANFAAFLACIYSDDEYIRYSGYLNMYEYVCDALYKCSPELYTDIAKKTSPKVRGELAAYSKFFDEYRDNVAADVSDTVNNAYLESQGTAGVVSYGMVVELAVAYFCQ